MEKYLDDFHYYYLNRTKIIESEALSLVPENEEIRFCKISDAISYFSAPARCYQKGSRQEITNDYAYLCYEVLKIAISKYGKNFDKLYRGCLKIGLKDEDHLMLFSTDDLDVVNFYGEKYGWIKTYENVFGLLTYPLNKSVVTEDWSYSDREIIFVPQNNQEAINKVKIENYHSFCDETAVKKQGLQRKENHL